MPVKIVTTMYFYCDLCGCPVHKRTDGPARMPEGYIVLARENKQTLINAIESVTEHSDDNGRPVICSRCVALVRALPVS